MIARPPRSTPTDTLLPYTTLFRSQDKRTNLPLSTKTRTASTGGSAPASHRPAFAAKASSMNVTNRKDALRDQRAKMLAAAPDWRASDARVNPRVARSEEHTSELQSLMRISYAVFCLKKKRKHKKPS